MGGMTEIDWRKEALDRGRNPDEAFLIELGKEAKEFHDLADKLYKVVERVTNRALFNKCTPEEERLYRRCIKIAKEDLDDKYQRLTTLRRYYKELIDALKPKPEGQKSQPAFTFSTESATASTKVKS